MFRWDDPPLACFTLLHFPDMTSPFKKPLMAALGLALALAGTASQAEGKLRIAEQFGIVYLLLNVAQDQQLIEKHGKAAGVDIQVERVQLSGGPAINEALLSGSIDIAGAGVGPLLTLWDKTQGRQNVRGIASLGNFPYYLTSSNPAVKSIDDFSDKDRIALPAVGVSVQSRILQLASARLWGDAQFNKLDRLQVAVPHPEATAALIKGGTEVSAHFGNPPFQEQELAGNPNARIVLKSYDVLGGPASATCCTPPRSSARRTPRPTRPSPTRWRRPPASWRATRRPRPTCTCASTNPTWTASCCCPSSRARTCSSP